MRENSINNEPTFWLNVTTSFRWQRSPVGIVRVEQEIRRHLHDKLQDRLQTIVFQDGVFVLEPAASPDLLASPEDFWPEPSYGSSADPFDLVQVPPAVHAKDSIVISRKPKFRHGDVLVTMGLDWEYPGLHEEIRELAQCHGLVVVTCCYDLIPILFPQYCMGDVASWFKNYVIDMTWISDGILCISENTRRDYLEFSRRIGLPHRQNAVIKLGSSLPSRATGDIISKPVEDLLRSRYFLFVSTIERRKNHEVLYRAYHLIRQENRDVDLPKLVFVGMQGWGISELLSDIKFDPLIKQDIVILSHVSDSELSELYAHCEAFLYPSLYEGWGLPIAEALQLGRPVLASNAGSIPEVGGDLVHYLDPWSPREWADEMLRVAIGETDIGQWSQEIAKRFVPYEWSYAAEAVISMAKCLLQSRSTARIIEPGYELSTGNGVHYGDKIIYDGGQGIACYGPYIGFAEGHYEATVRIRWVSGGSGHLHIAVCHSLGRIRVAAAHIDTRSLKAGEHDITLPFELAKDFQDVEFVCQVKGSETVKFSIDRITIVRCKPFLGNPPAVIESEMEAAGAK